MSPGTSLWTAPQPPENPEVRGRMSRDQPCEQPEQVLVVLDVFSSPTVSDLHKTEVADVRFGCKV
jgi:hypothetical protein